MSNDIWTGDFGGISLNPPPWAAKRPVRIAILGDFGGGALAGRLDRGTALAKRKPLKVEFDTLEDALGRLDLKLQLPLGSEGASFEVELSELESFHPDELYRNVELFAALASLRKRLNTASSFAAAAAEVQGWAASGDERLQRASSLARHTPSRGSAPSRGATLDDFARLTGRKSSAAEADDSIGALLKRVVGPFVQPAASPDKDKLIATVDAALTDAMRAVLHHPDFQNLESLWRGVDFVLRRLETSHQLQVHLIDISAEELAADLSAVQDLSESGLYKLLVETPSQEADGGYTYIAGCYQFDATPPHAELLGRMAHVAAHAGAPFITAIATDPFADRREPPHRLVKEAFAALRALPDASYLGLIGPRFLLRHPYGKKSDPISSFAFEEFGRDAGLRGMLWGHPALLAVTVLGQRGGQLVIDDLPFHHYVDKDGDSVALPCTDRLISTNVATLLRDFGINGVMAHKGEALVRLAGLEAINGDGLAAPGTGQRKPAADSRGAIQTRIGRDSGTAAGGAAVAERRAGTVQTSAVFRTAEADAAEAADAAESEAPADIAAEAPAPAPADASAGAQAEAPAEAAVDDELAALLASLDEPATPAAVAEAAAEEPAVDPELEALLKSLG